MNLRKGYITGLAWLLFVNCSEDNKPMDAAVLPTDSQVTSIDSKLTADNSSVDVTGDSNAADAMTDSISTDAKADAISTDAEADSAAGDAAADSAPVDAAVPLCDDKIKNGNETDIDCGGSTCPKCEEKQKCKLASDCTSAVCGNDGLCAAPKCDDKVKNGDETDIDCGGLTCDPCLLDQKCSTHEDCATHNCTTTCSYAKGCAALKANGVTTDGDYTIDCTGGDPADAFKVYCDMTTDSGGWNEITLDLAFNTLNGKLTVVSGSPTSGMDQNKPYTTDGADNHTAYYTFDFACGYSEFYLKDYVIKARAGAGHTSDINIANFKQTSWSVGFKAGGSGDVSFGSPDNSGPTTSYSAKLPSNLECFDCTKEWPAGNEIFSIGTTSSAFRIGWGEAGSQAEGWYPWWSGSIMLR